eukprot:scaffold1385_cov115-Isochrysis_galbana.AAC.5
MLCFRPCEPAPYQPPNSPPTLSPCRPWASRIAFTVGSLQAPRAFRQAPGGPRPHPPPACAWHRRPHPLAKGAVVSYSSSTRLGSGLVPKLHVAEGT